MICREGFGIHHVQGCPEPPGCDLFGQRSGIHHRPPGDINHQRPVRQCRQHLGVNEVPGLLIQRRNDHQHFSFRGKHGKFRYAVDPACVVVACSAAHSRELHLERLKAGRYLPSDPAHNNQQNPAVSKTRIPLRIPVSLQLVPHRGVDAAQ